MADTGLEYLVDSWRHDPRFNETSLLDNAKMFALVCPNCNTAYWAIIWNDKDKKRLVFDEMLDKHQCSTKPNEFVITEIEAS